MLFQDRSEARQVIVQAWQRHRCGLPLEPLAALIVQVVAAHPEYHALLEDPQAAVAAEFPPGAGQTNPFLHMGMHVAIQEQLSTDRPPGIAALVTAARPRFTHAHALEHRLMECLGQVLWQAQRRGTAPDEAAYLECVRRMAP
ncbi:MAG: DUF1841 family protein [Gammaproteobacteria bacterium]|nr:DUF1841 family protein [Gammaproteobacteria bacterium]